MPAGQLRVIFRDGFSYQSHQHLVGVAASRAYFQTRVASLETFQGNAHGYIFRIGLGFLVLQRRGDVHSAGAAYDEFPFLLRVQVEEYFPFQFASGQSVGTVHSCFLVGGDERFHWAVLQVGGFHHGHDGGHA